MIPLIKVGRGMYSVIHNESRVTRFLVCQIYSVEGSKYIKIRSPFQVGPQPPSLSKPADRFSL